MTYRILVTGSREWTKGQMIQDAICDELLRRECGTDAVVVHGGARGADALSGAAANVLGLRVESHPADWSLNGKAAGFIRNAKMVNLGADVCLAFFRTGAGNRGTMHCSDLARNAGIPVVEVWD